MTKAGAAQVLTTTATGGSGERRTLPKAVIVALVTVAVLTLAVVTWQLMASTSTTAPVQDAPAAAADPWAAYRPGGSVYQQQVPKAAS